MCAALLFRIYGSQGLSAPLQRARLSGRFTASRLLSEGGSGQIRFFTDTFTKITYAGSVMRFPIHKDYYGEPAHHIGVPDLVRLLNHNLI